MTETLAQALGRFASDHTASGLASELHRDVVNRLVDLVGVALAAAGDPTVDAVESTVASWGGAAQATVMSSGRRLPAPNAALVNGTLAHALDFDDTHLPSIVHPSSSIVPAALAVGEEMRANGRSLMTAVGIGLEVCLRLGMASYDRAARNHVFFERGLHATSILGALGAAVAAACLYGLDAAQITSAIGIASSMGSGLLEANRTGGTVKRMHTGWAAHSGVAAAQLARNGLTGPPTVLEGRFGLLQAFSGDRWDAGVVTDDLGVRWEFPRVHYKPYPTNHFTHAGIDAALAARARGIDTDAIVRIELGVPEPTLRTIAEPADEKAAPRTGYAAKFSGPFTVASALSGGGGLGVGHDDFTDVAVRDDERLRLASVVTCVADEEASARFPEAFGGVLRIWTDAGLVFEQRVADSRGGPETPLAPGEVDHKFTDNVARTRSAGAARDLLALLRDTASIDDVSALASAFAQLR